MHGRKWNVGGWQFSIKILSAIASPIYKGTCGSITAVAKIVVLPRLIEFLDGEYKESVSTFGKLAHDAREDFGLLINCFYSGYRKKKKM